MPIITCPDCGHHPVSDRAPTCPKCGCPIAMSTATSGPANAPVALSAQPDGNQAIAQLESMVKEAERELLTSDQAQEVVRRIAEFKRTAFSSREAFIEASIANRILVLGDEDVDILKSLNDDQRSRIKALYALGCDRFDGTMLQSLKGSRNLASLDLSYSNGMEADEIKSVLGCGNNLSVLEHLYLRRNRRLDGYVVMYWLKYLPRLAELYLDGSLGGSTNDVSDNIIIVHATGGRILRTLSIQGCSQLANSEFLGMMRELLPLRPQLKVIGP